MDKISQRHIYDYFIDHHGNWFCEGNPVSDPQLFRMLSRSLFCKEGNYFIRCEGEVHPVRVADAPLWVRYVHVGLDKEGNLTGVEIELQDGRREPLAPETLSTVTHQELYCLATHRRLKARFAKTAYYELAKYLQMEGDAANFYLVIDGRKNYIGSEPKSDPGV